MAQKQTPEPWDGKNRRKPENEPARLAFARLAESSTFASTFRSMEEGQATIAAALGVLARVNDMSGSEKGYAREVVGMQSIFRTFGRRPHNPYAAEFLAKAAETIPHLKEPLAKEVVAGLEKAVENVAYFWTARATAERLLAPGAAALPNAVRRKLETVLAAPDPKTVPSSDRATPLENPILGPARGAGGPLPAAQSSDRSVPVTSPISSSSGIDTGLSHNEDETEKRTPRWVRWAIGGAVVLGLATAGMLLLRGGSKSESNGPAPPAAVDSAPKLPAQDASPGPDARNAPESVLNVGPERKAVRRKPAVKPHFNSYNTVSFHPLADPIQVIDKEIDAQAEGIAARIVSSQPEETESLFAALGPAAANPDAGPRLAGQRDAGTAVCQENVAVAALRRLALGTDDAKAARAIRKLGEFAWYGTDQKAASEALSQLGKNPAVINSPARLDALLMATQPAPKLQ